MCCALGEATKASPFRREEECEGCAMQSTIDGLSRPRRNGSRGLTLKRWDAHYRAVRFARRLFNEAPGQAPRRDVAMMKALDPAEDLALVSDEELVGRYRDSGRTADFDA